MLAMRMSLRVEAQRLLCLGASEMFCRPLRGLHQNIIA
jgi:hypothetical protein